MNDKAYKFDKRHNFEEGEFEVWRAMLSLFKAYLRLYPQKKNAILLKLHTEINK